MASPLFMVQILIVNMNRKNLETRAVRVTVTLALSCPGESA